MRDTPFEREHIAQMPFNTLVEWVEELRARRLAAQRAYEEVRAAKSKIKEEKDLERYKKVLTMLGNKLNALERAHTAIDKYMVECNLLRLQFGDNPWQKNE